MKVETKKIYTFEEGDIIACTMYNWVAVRHAGEKWIHTNHQGTHDGRLRWDFTDEEVILFLEGGSWVYMGNAKP
jgi:hypothetical protein